MTRGRHGVYGDLGSALGEAEAGAGQRDSARGPGQEAPERGGARFLKRSNALDPRARGEFEEKVLRLVDPATCRIWERHNRAYELLSEDTCRELIDGIRAQGRQEFPAVVRETGDEHRPYEVICGARRHFAITWLRAHGHAEMRYLIEVRDLDDEAAFRLSDIENRDREDLSDYERARDYADALSRYYGGSQKAMAARLEVSESWLSRFVGLSKLPEVVVGAFPTIRDLREAHARTLLPLMGTSTGRGEIMCEARAIAEEQKEAREGRGAPVPAPEVFARLKAVAPRSRPRPAKARVFRVHEADSGMRMTRRGRNLVLEVPEDAQRQRVEAWMAQFLKAQFGD